MEVFCLLFHVILLSLGSFVNSKKAIMNDVKLSEEDASEITWAHAVNSRAALLKEIAGPVDFLEADVSMGHMGAVIGPLIPIMAHPPNVYSDISLKDWLDILIVSNSSKSVKLDFKSLDVVEPSLRILLGHTNELNFTLWLNADILFGPVNSITPPVPDGPFLRLCKQYFPDAVLSVGWTTKWFPNHPSAWHYEWKHVRKMVDVIRCFVYEHNFPTFTFPVRGIFVSRSIKQLQWLLATIPGSTLTVWSDKRDPLLLQDLVIIRRSFPKNKVYYDIPERFQNSFLNVKKSKSYVPDLESSIKDDQWITITHGKDHTCASNTYVSNKTAVFGSSLKTAVLLKKLLSGDLSQSLKVTGKIHFFIGTDQPPVGNHKLTIAITDVSLFSKNSSSVGQEALDLSGSDTDVLWDALNASHLYTFEHNFSNKPSGCRVFKLDTSADHSFQAWTVPCDEMDDQKSIDELISYGKSEISSRKRMVLPEVPFMIGFVSSGDSHVVLYDFEIDGKKFNISSAPSISTTSFRSVALIGLSVVVGYVIKRYLQ